MLCPHKSHVAVNDELTKIINLVQLMDLTLNNRPIVDSDGDLFKECLVDIAYIFANLPENSIQSNSKFPDCFSAQKQHS